MCQFEARKGLDVRIVRPFNVYGPRLHGDENGQVVSMMMEASPIEVHGDGLQTRSLTWVGDVVEAFIKVGTQEGLEGQAFNLGSTDEISMIDLATKIADFVELKLFSQSRIMVIANADYRYIDECCNRLGCKTSWMRGFLTFCDALQYVSNP